MPNHRRQDRELDALYAQLPTIECSGYCHDSCGPIEMSVRERTRILEAAGPVTCGAGASCSMLTAERRCGVYSIRPMICRLWGLVPKLRCPYGCRPERWLSDSDAAGFLVAADGIGGNPGGDRRQRLYERMLAALSDEQIMAVMAQVVQSPTLADRPHALRRSGVRSTLERF